MTDRGRGLSDLDEPPPSRDAPTVQAAGIAPDAQGSVDPATGPGVPMGRRVADAARGLVTPLLALVSALVIGGLVIIASDPDLLEAIGSDPATALAAGLDSVATAYRALVLGSLGSANALSETLLQATPLIFAGLAVALGFRSGLFNIGAEGQIYVGGALATLAGFAISGLPWFVHLPLAILAGFVGGAVWGFIPGILKARTGAHEVIVTIMLNYVAYRLIDYLLNQEFFQREGRTDPISRIVAESAQLPRIVEGFRVHWGLVLAVVAAVLVSWLLFRSTKGFEFRAVGLNPSAARYAGISISTTIVLTMMISGGLAGLAGATQILGVTDTLTPNFSPGWGFDAIALALLGRSRPLGVVMAALLFGALRAGATPMQAATDVPIDLVVVIQALVIMFIAAPALVRGIYRIKVARTTGAEVFSKGWGS